MATLNGDSTNNVLAGTNSSDSISGGGGDDVILAGGGNDSVSGGSGDDTILAGAGNDSVSGGSGSDYVDGGAGNDVIDGGAGNDRLFGGAGSDLIYGGSGSDWIEGGSGNDLLFGGAGSDTIFGGEGNDVIEGGAGDDAIYGQSGNDILLGGAGNDLVDGGTGRDIVAGGSGHDKLFGDNGDDVMDGGGGDDLIAGGAGNDALFGGAGNDTLIGGAGVDYLQGGSGSDRFVFEHASDSSAGGSWDRIVDFQHGKDKIDLSALLGSGNLAFGGKLQMANGVSFSNGGSSTFISADVNGDGVADFKVELLNTLGLQLSAADIIGAGVNLRPEASHAFVAGNEDTKISGEVLATDPEGGALTYSVVDGPVNGTVVLNGDGSFTYTPTANFNGTDQFTYKVNDGSSDSNVATVDLTVNSVNDAPVAQAVSGTTDEGSVLNGKLAATDTDDENLTYSLFGTEVAGLAIHPGGTFQFDPRGLFDSLAVGTQTEFSFQYVANDGKVDSAPATATIKVTGVNDAPEAAADVLRDAVDDGNVQTVDATGNVLANDTDLDNGETGKLIVSEVQGVAPGDPIDGEFGTLTFNDSGDGTWFYTLNSKGSSTLAEKGSLDLSFNYTVVDPHGATDSSTLAIHFTSTGTVQTVTSSPSSADSLVTDTGGDTSSDPVPQSEESNTPAPVSQPASANDNVITGVWAGDQVDIPVWALLANDANANGNPLRIESVGGTSNGDMVSFIGGNIAFTDADEFAASSFTYVANYGSSSGNPVTVTVSQDVDGILNGTAGSDILIGARYEMTTFVGNEGDDILFGGHFSDTFDYNAVSDRGASGDMIVGFQKGMDNLDLHDLLGTLSGYDASNAFSGGYLQFALSGGDTLVQVDGDGGGDSFETLATVVGVQLSASDTGDFIL